MNLRSVTTVPIQRHSTSCQLAPRYSISAVPVATWAAPLQKERRCQITAVDMFPLAANVRLNRFIQQDLNAGLPDVQFSEYDYVLLLDVIEHLASPEAFVDGLRDSMKYCTATKIIVVSTPNVGFIIIRLMMLFGQFNYGKRGILDMTHRRLFTFSVAESTPRTARLPGDFFARPAGSLSSGAGR